MSICGTLNADRSTHTIKGHEAFDMTDHRSMFEIAFELKSGCDWSVPREWALRVECRTDS